MQRQEHNHGLSGKVMHAADNLTQKHFVLDEIDTLPRRLCARTICRPQEQTGDELQNKGKDQCAAPDVAPSGALPGRVRLAFR